MNREALVRQVIAAIERRPGSWFVGRSYMLCPHRSASGLCSTCLGDMTIGSLAAEVDNAFRTAYGVPSRDESYDADLFVGCRCCGISYRRRTRTNTPRYCPMCTPSFSYEQCAQCHASHPPAGLLPVGYEHLSVCAHCNRRCNACGQTHPHGGCQLEPLRNIGPLNASATTIISRPCTLDVMKHVRRGEKPLLVSTPLSVGGITHIVPNGFTTEQIQEIAALFTEIQPYINVHCGRTVTIVCATTKLHADGPDFAILGPTYTRLVSQVVSGGRAQGRFVLAGGLTATTDELTWIYIPLPTTDAAPAEVLRRTVFAAACAQRPPALYPGAAAEPRTAVDVLSGTFGPLDFPQVTEQFRRELIPRTRVEAGRAARARRTTTSPPLPPRERPTYPLEVSENRSPTRYYVSIDPITGRLEHVPAPDQPEQPTPPDENPDD